MTAERDVKSGQHVEAHLRTTGVLRRKSRINLLELQASGSRPVYCWRKSESTSRNESKGGCYHDLQHHTVDNGRVTPGQ